MTLAELQDAIANAREHGHRWIMLVVPREGRGQRMRVAPGLMGTVRAVNCDGHSVVECEVEAVERFAHTWTIRTSASV